MEKQQTVRIETYSDEFYEDVIRIVDNFYKEAIHYHDVGFDKESLGEVITQLKVNNTGNAFLLIVDNKCEGMLAGFEAPSLLNRKRIFQELIWYVNEPCRQHGVALLKKVQKILKAEGFNTMIMVALEASKPDKVKMLYERMGYKHFETHYIKEL